jgi:hypothetical protein
MPRVVALDAGFVGTSGFKATRAGTSALGLMSDPGLQISLSRFVGDFTFRQGLNQAARDRQRGQRLLAKQRRNSQGPGVCTHDPLVSQIQAKCSPAMLAPHWQRSVIHEGAQPTSSGRGMHAVSAKAVLVRRLIVRDAGPLAAELSHPVMVLSPCSVRPDGAIHGDCHPAFCSPKADSRDQEERLTLDDLREPVRFQSLYNQARGPLVGNSATLLLLCRSKIKGCANC